MIWTPKAEMYSDMDGLHVQVSWSGPEALDRPSTGGWLFDESQRRTAERLCAAINAGVVYKNPRMVRDVNGRSYVQAEQTQFFHKRHMNSSLRAVGF